VVVDGCWSVAVVDEAVAAEFAEYRGDGEELLLRPVGPVPVMLAAYCC
jgi:hypothetical protein